MNGSLRWAGVAATVVILLMLGCGEDKPSKPKTTPATISSVDPDTGNVGTRVEITGTGFQSGARVFFGNREAVLTELVSATTLLAYAPDSLTAGTMYSVRVTNSSNGSVVREAAYKAVPPDLRVIDGVSRPSAQSGSPVILEGRSFGDLLGKGTVYFTDGGGQPVAADVELPENWTNEFIVTTVPSAAASGPVWIETPTGPSGSIFFTISQSATFSPSQIHWMPTTSLPDSLQGLGAAFLEIEGGAGSGNLIFVTGGADGASLPQSGVWSAEVSGGGGLSSWIPASSLPAPRAFHGCVVATPYNAYTDTTDAGHLYVLGGIADSAGAPVFSVLGATVGKDRSLGAWQELTPLPVPLHSMGVTIFRSWIFVAGGATLDNAPVAGVWRARINFDGSLGSWESVASLPSPRAYAPLGQFAGALYVVGGEASAVAPGDASPSETRLDAIVFERLDLRTALPVSDAWSVSSAHLIKTVAKHSVVIAGATMLVSGGLYNGDGSSATEHQYGEIGADYTIGSFNGATGSQTIGGSSGAGGVPFFNHAAITYVDGSGEAHVIILGGADVNEPLRAIGEAYYY